MRPGTVPGLEGTTIAFRGKRDVRDGFPEREQYELISQLRRVAVPIPSNIAEG
ncbi:four helix bundle protein [Salinibacter ruber]|uniref:four helix bundle protein n=1 Tax=Salinibacter ruber TaxID=146919 RepID=UPI00161B9DE0